MTTTRAARQADAVFRGTVTALNNEGRGEEARTDIRFEVDAVYKGTVYRDQVVASAAGQRRLRAGPRRGQHLGHLRGRRDRGRGDDAVARLITSTCSGNLPTGSAPALLGDPRGRSTDHRTARNGRPAPTGG